MKVKIRYRTVDGRSFGSLELKSMREPDGRDQLVASEDDVVRAVAESNAARRAKSLPEILEDAWSVEDAECCFQVVDANLGLVRVVPAGGSAFGESRVERKA